MGASVPELWRYGASALALYSAGNSSCGKRPRRSSRATLGVLIVAKTSAVPGWQLALVILTGTVVGVVVVSCLYWAQTVFIPVALAVFLTFLLAPRVTALQRRGLRRLPSVMLVVLLAAAVLSGVV